MTFDFKIILKVSLTLFFILINQSSQSIENVSIATTLPYLEDIAKNIICVKKSVDVTSIVQTGSSPHAFVLSLSDRIKIEHATVVIALGNEIDHWVDKIPKKEGQTWIFVASPNEKDPHIWQSPRRTKEVAQKISSGLTAAKILTKQEADTCEQKYIGKVNQTTKELKSIVQSIPKENRILATNHDSLFYFAQEFGFRLITVLGSNDEEQPTPQQIRRMIASVQKEHAKSLFLESTGNMKNLESISRDTGVKIGGELYGDSLGPQGSGAESTIGMWKTNVETIAKALK